MPPKTEMMMRLFDQLSRAAEMIQIIKLIQILHKDNAIKMLIVCIKVK